MISYETSIFPPFHPDTKEGLGLIKIVRPYNNDNQYSVCEQECIVNDFCVCGTNDTLNCVCKCGCMHCVEFHPACDCMSQQCHLCGSVCANHHECSAKQVKRQCISKFLITEPRHWVRWEQDIFSVEPESILKMCYPRHFEQYITSF